MRKFLLAAGAAFLGFSATAQPAEPPKLIVAIAVDQLSADLFDEYRPSFTAGFARLSSGTVFPNGYQSHSVTETCPGHSTILTGDHPAHTGIIGNHWIDQSIARSDKNVYCAEDESVPGTSSIAYKVSPKHLLVPTLGDLIKARWPHSHNVAVSGKDRAAVMMSGHNVDQRWYWTGARFESDLTFVAVPAVVAKVNALAAAGLATARSPLEPTPLCQSKARVIAVEGGGKPVGAGAFARPAGNQSAFRASPELDGDTLALAAALVDSMRLGRHADPDLLSIGLSATDYVGHSYGTEGQEMCLNLTELDREIGDFLNVLDSRKLDYEVVLTADHGGEDMPERQRLAGVTDAARVDSALSASAMGKSLAAKLGLPGPGLLGNNSFGDMYVDKRLSGPERQRLLDAAISAYREHPQVEAVFTAAQIAATPIATTPPESWSLIQRVRASYYPGRSGDFFVVLKKDLTPIANTTHSVATHGSPWDYDRRVPIIFWRSGASGTIVEHSVDTTDVMPTLASMIGLPVKPGSIDGHCLAEVPGAHCPAD